MTASLASALSVVARVKAWAERTAESDAGTLSVIERWSACVRPTESLTGALSVTARVKAWAERLTLSVAAALSDSVRLNGCEEREIESESRTESATTGRSATFWVVASLIETASVTFSVRNTFAGPAG